MAATAPVVAIRTIRFIFSENSSNRLAVASKSS